MKKLELLCQKAFKPEILGHYKDGKWVEVVEIKDIEFASEVRKAIYNYDEVKEKLKDKDAEISTLRMQRNFYALLAQDNDIFRKLDDAILKDVSENRQVRSEEEKSEKIL